MIGFDDGDKTVLSTDTGNEVIASTVIVMATREEFTNGAADVFTLLDPKLKVLTFGAVVCALEQYRKATKYTPFVAV